MVVMHVSNRHLELASVVAGIAAANGLMTRVNDTVDLDETAHPYKYSGTVAAAGEATRISARSRRATTGSSRNRIRINGYGPTITPISSAR